MLMLRLQSKEKCNQKRLEGELQQQLQLQQQQQQQQLQLQQQQAFIIQAKDAHEHTQRHFSLAAANRRSTHNTRGAHQASAGFLNAILCIAFVLFTNVRWNDDTMSSGSISVEAFTLNQSKSQSPFVTARSTARSTARILNSSLNMVTTKSGGKPIVTIEQFQTEVLLQTDDEIDGVLVDTNESATAKTKDSNPILVLYSAPW